MLSGCSDKPKAETTEKTDAKKTADILSDTSAAHLSDDHAVAAMMSEGFFIGFKMSMEGSDIPKDKLNCLTSIDKFAATQPIQSLLEKEMTPTDLVELNAFYASDFGKKFLRFGKEQVLIMTGKLQAPTVTLTESDTEKLTAYMQSAGAQKLMSINGGAEQDKMLDTIRPVVLKQAEKCSISKEELNLP